MGLDRKCFDYCSEIGLLEERSSKQYALDSIKEEVKKVYSADPAFIQKVQSLTLSSPEVSTRACVIYHYDAEIEYVIGGNIRDTKVSNYGYNHISDSLHITEFADDAKYRTLKSADEIPYDVYHQDNLFTYDEMKKALTDTIGEKLPSNYSSYRSKSWNVSAYIVPVLVVIIKHNGENYYQYYNLHNNYYSWNWPIDPVIIKKGKQTKNLAAAARVFSIILAGLATVIGFANFGNGESEIISALLPLGVTILNWFLNKKAKENPKSYQKVYEENRDKNMFSLIVKECVMVGLALVALIFALV